MKLKKLINKFKRVCMEDGFLAAVERVFHFAGNIEGREVRRLDVQKAMSSQGVVLFINGYFSENPIRYRVFHQMEQLEIAGIACAKVYFEDIEMEMVDNYQFFIFYRCEYTKEVEAFIKLAKEQCKKVCFDVDDLVIDTKYTDQVPFVQEFSPEIKKVFDSSVMLTKKTLMLCDMATTTTEALTEELGEFVPEAYVNRNTASKEMIACAERAYKEYKRDFSDRIWLGYFSGSLTHNKDFEIIRPVLMRLMDQYSRVGLILVGELDTSDELKKFEDRIVRKKVTDWRELPKLIVQADINLAPLEDTLFNRAKSEIKWIEAALVRVPTVASKVGAFEKMIEDGGTGILCENTKDAWFEAINRLIVHKNERKCVGEDAYKYVLENCTTVGKAQEYALLIKNMICESNNRN